MQLLIVAVEKETVSPPRVFDLLLTYTRNYTNTVIHIAEKVGFASIVSKLLGKETESET